MAGRTDEASFDVFVSWTRRDVEDQLDPHPRQLVRILTDRGLRVWFDETDLGPFDAIGETVHEAIGRSKIFVAWYGREYANRRACREELTLAMLASRRHRGPGRVVAVLPDGRMHQVVTSPLLDLELPDLTDAGALSSAIVRRVRAVNGPIGAVDRVDRPRIYGGLGWTDGSRRFVGRLGELWAIHDQLQPSSIHDQTNVGRAGRSVSLVSGFGGVGKSLLAAEYVHLFANLYPGGVMWLSAQGNAATGERVTASESDRRASAEWTGVAVDLGLAVDGLDTDQIRAAVRAVVIASGRPWLLVVDDLPSGLTKVQRDRWLLTGPELGALVTSRDVDADLDPIVVGALDQVSTLALLGAGAALSAEQADAARAIHDALGGHALAIDVTARAIARTGRSLSDVAAALTDHATLASYEQLAEQLSREHLMGDHALGITATIAHSLDAVGSEGRALLAIAGLLPPVPIPVSVVEDVWRRLGRGAWDATPYGSAIDAAQIDSCASVQNGSISVHALVGGVAVARSGFAEVDRSAWLELVRYALASQLAEAANHLTADDDLVVLARQVLDQPELTGASRSLLRVIAELDLAARRDELALAGWERLVAATFADGRFDQTYDDARRFLSDCLANLGRHEDALAVRERLASDIRGRDGDAALSTLVAENRVAQTLPDLGRSEEAARVLEQNTPRIERMVGADHVATYLANLGLANAYRRLGRHQDAIDIQQTLLDRLEGDAGTEDSAPALQGDLATSLLETIRNNLATSFIAIGHTAEAIELYEAAVTSQRAKLRTGHPASWTLETNLANGYRDGGRFQDAIDLGTEIWKSKSEVLGRRHRDALAIQEVITASLIALGRHVEAVPLMTQLVEDSSTGLGANDPLTLVRRATLATTLFNAGRSREARRLARSILDDPDPGVDPLRAATSELIAVSLRPRFRALLGVLDLLLLVPLLAFGDSPAAMYGTFAGLLTIVGGFVATHRWKGPRGPRKRQRTRQPVDQPAPIDDSTASTRSTGSNTACTMP